MREHSRDKERLLHIIECIKRVGKYTEGVTMQELVADDMRFYAVVKNIEIIGEAANMLTQDFRDAHTEIPWKMVVGMRNYIVHEYFRIDNDIVWEVVSNELPILQQQISSYIEQNDYPHVAQRFLL